MFKFEAWIHKYEMQPRAAIGQLSCIRGICFYYPCSGISTRTTSFKTSVCLQCIPLALVDSVEDVHVCIRVCPSFKLKNITHHIMMLMVGVAIAKFSYTQVAKMQLSVFFNRRRVPSHKNSPQNIIVIFHSKLLSCESLIAVVLWTCVMNVPLHFEGRSPSGWSFCTFLALLISPDD